MLIDCAELSNQVLRVLRPLDDSRTEDFYKYIVFTGDGIISYNDRICVFIKHKTGLECALPAKKFFSVLPKTGEADFKIKSAQLIIKTENTTAKLATGEVSELLDSIKSIKIKKKRDWKKIPEGFLTGLSMCYSSASKEMNEPAMTCVYINDDRIAATDEVRISEYKLNQGIGQEVLIPAKSVGEFIMYDGLTHYFIDEHWIYFTDKRKSRKFCARLVNSEFPDYKPHFEFESMGTVSLPVRETVEAVRYVSPMAIEDDHGFSWMNVVLKSKLATFITTDESIGEARATAPLSRKVKGELSFYINPSFLVHIIRDAHKMNIGEDRAKFETENFTHLIALLRRGEED